MSQSANSPVAAPSVKDSLGLRVQTEGEYVVGLPMPMALYIKATHLGAQVSLLPEPTPFALHGCIGFALHDAQGKLAASFDAPGGHGRGHELPELSLRGGEERRFLIDLSEIVPPQKPGKYRLTLHYVAPARRVTAGAVEVLLRAPTDVEKKWIDAHAHALEEAGSWGRWATSSWDPAQAPVPVASVPALARFLALGQVLFHDPTPLAGMDAGALSQVVGVAKPEAESMRVELLRAAGQPADALAAQLSVANPALAWLVERAQQDIGLVGTYRSAR